MEIDPQMARQALDLCEEFVCGEITEAEFITYMLAMAREYRQMAIEATQDDCERKSA
jgi:hypothetical protein